MEKYFDFEQQAYKILLENNQEHLLQNIDNFSKEERQVFAQQVLHLEKIIPGGIKQYVQTAQQQLEMNLKGINPYSDYTASIPLGKTLELSKLEEIMKYEEIGMQEMKDTCFVLLAGGLGERLGYSGIKIAISLESITNQSYLEYYISYIKAFESKLNTSIPLVIMVSGDTSDLTHEFLQKNKNFGLSQLYVIKQEKYPAMIDNLGRFAMIKDKLEIETKPHGHGDIHSLIYQNQLAQKFYEQGKKWLVFFQDTNPAVFRSYPSVLGISKEFDLEMNSITVPRKPGEAVGAIMSLVNKNNNKSLTINIEYNQIQSVLGGQKEQVDHNGFSVYPGNINSLIFQIKDYIKTLAKTQGQITEFINPKYKDEKKVEFKSSSRLECMMQDYPKLLESGDRVGFSQLDRIFCFTTCKNDIQSAKDKQKQGLSPESASSCESDFYLQNIKIMELLGAQIEQQAIQDFKGIQLQMGPKIILGPKLGVTFKELQQKLKGQIKISANSTLIIQEDVVINGLELDGSLKVTKDITNQKCDDKNYIEFKEIDCNDKNYTANQRIRGYIANNIHNIKIL